MFGCTQHLGIGSEYNDDDIKQCNLYTPERAIGMEYDGSGMIVSLVTFAKGFGLPKLNCASACQIVVPLQVHVGGNAIQKTFSSGGEQQPIAYPSRGSDVPLRVPACAGGLVNTRCKWHHTRWRSEACNRRTCNGTLGHVKAIGILLERMRPLKASVSGKRKHADRGRTAS